MALSVAMAVGQKIHAPEWLRQQVETRIEQNLGGMDLSFGEVSVIVNKGWRPRVRLENLNLKDSEGRQIIQLRDVEATIAVLPLLSGQIQPERVQMNGAFITLRRGEDGNLTLAFDNFDRPVNSAPNMAELIEEWDRVFLRPQFASLSSLELNGINLNYEDLRHKRAWTLDGGRIQITLGEDSLRLATGFTLLSGGDTVSAIEANYSSKLGQPDAFFGVSVTDLPAADIALQTPALAWMQVLRAPISGALRGSVDEAGTLGPISATLQIAAGVLQPNEKTKPIPFNGARTYFTFDPLKNELDFNELSVDSAWGSANAEGKAYLDGVEQGQLENLVGQFQFASLSVNPAGLFKDPISLDRVDVDFQMKLNPFRFQVGQMNIKDQDQTLRLSGLLAAKPAGWLLDVDGALDRTTPAHILSYWPPSLAVKPRLWVQKNLMEGEATNADLALRIRPGVEPKLFGNFDFSNAKVKFAKTLPPVVGGRGQASLTGKRFALLAHAGTIVTDHGDTIDATGTSFIIPNITIPKAAPGIARIIGSGSVASFLSLLDRPPLNVMKEANLPVDLAKGQVNVSGTLALPLKDRVTIDDMEFHLTGDVSNVHSSVLVPGVDISAPLLQVSGNQTGLTLSGDGFFGAVPLTASWHQPIGKVRGQRSRLTGEIEVSQRLLQQLETGLPPEMVSGTGKAQLTLELGGKQPTTLSVLSDLQGVRLALPDLNWVKPPNVKGSLDLKATLGKTGVIETISIAGNGLRANGSLTFDESSGLKRARFRTFELGQSVAVPVELIGQGKGNAPQIRILGGVIDLRKLPETSGAGAGVSSGQTSEKMDVKLDRLQVTDSIALTAFTGQFSAKGALSGNFTAQLNGQTSLQGQVLARKSGTGVFLQSDDAGGILRASGIMDQAFGGDFKLSLEPLKGAGFYDGRLKINKTRIRDAPAMAALFNAISVVGLVDQMAGQGILFSEIDGKMRISPNSIRILEGSAVGPSIGLSVDGSVDTERKRLNLRGVVSPIYLLNAIGSVLTRKGEGVIGFNYTLTGPMDRPDVWVNPLSGLAPGFLRNLLRAPSDLPPISPAPAPTKGPSSSPKSSPGGNR
ncbi:hypothetical protein DS909_15560 [Phaeobacter gallaeciensis]|uniref:YhdP central domain-containing protein n=3 Tax=Rhodobacterales TaxID=204455 RepID=A0A366WUY9_9RHOB|nr:DUF3971 domain-containing protein [Falsiruegeria litorea]MBT8170450.1 DUF3971 domain-containing protein [Falsiruegeria litorea]RBW52947.1 hypothetical protein DS909_15560 [Phaeobacter gallaeciensis]